MGTGRKILISLLFLIILPSSYYFLNKDANLATQVPVSEIAPSQTPTSTPLPTVNTPGTVFKTPTTPPPTPSPSTSIKQIRSRGDENENFDN